MFGLLGDDPDCECEWEFEGDRLHVRAGACGGAVTGRPACRATVVRALARRGATTVVVRDGGVERTHDASLLAAAGRFVAAVDAVDADLATRAAVDPLAAGRAAAGRAGTVGRLAEETGLAAAVAGAEGYAGALATRLAPACSRWRVAPEPPPGATLADRTDLATGAVARVYTSPGDLPTYHLRPVEVDLAEPALQAIHAARSTLATLEGPRDQAVRRAVRRALEGSAGPVEADVDTLAAVLGKHVRAGLLVDLFADPAVSDAFLPGPAGETRGFVRRSGRRLRTNLSPAPDGPAALASLLRRVSGRPLARTDPTLSVTLDVGDRRVRATATVPPASEGYSFAFRAHDRDPWRLEDLVGNRTMGPRAAGLLSVAVRRGAAVLVAGERGAGKTTALGALLWELPANDRILVVEDAPELPIGALQDAGRDVQRLRASAAFDAEAALRTALRLGESALVVGEVRGEEAQVLYEAMRVGADGGAVLGTIHGGDADRVRERVVTDLGVPASAFADTDLVATLSARDRADGTAHRLVGVEEVLPARNGVEFAPLFRSGETTGRIDRGNCATFGTLAEPGESYAEVRALVTERAETLSTAADGTGPTLPAGA